MVEFISFSDWEGRGGKHFVIFFLLSDVLVNSSVIFFHTYYDRNCPCTQGMYVLSTFRECYRCVLTCRHTVCILQVFYLYGVPSSLPLQNVLQLHLKVKVKPGVTVKTHHCQEFYNDKNDIKKKAHLKGNLNSVCVGNFCEFK